MTRGRVLHLSSAHTVIDNRIVEKECRSLAEAGFSVTVIGLAPERASGVAEAPNLQTIGLSRPGGRLARITTGSWRCFRLAAARDDEIIHFHDPELVPWMLVLRLRGRRVVFDVHEDYTTAVARSGYIPGPLKPVVAAFWRSMQALCRRAFHIVIAERYYGRAFPDAVPVLNYPRLDQFADLLSAPRPTPPERPRLLYTGNVTYARGAALCARLAHDLPHAEVHLVGRTEPWLALELRDIAGPNARFAIVGEGELLPFSRIVASYREPWTAGLAIMPDSPHYREKELTKFFEYMAAGLPIIASNFPVWRELIEGTGAGICVDPADPAALAKAVEAIHGSPERAAAMGEAGRRAVRERFNWDSEAKRLVDLYDRLLARAA